MLFVCGFSRSGKLCLLIQIVSTILMQNSMTTIEILPESTAE